MKKEKDTKKRRGEGKASNRLKEKGTIASSSKGEKPKVADHPFFGMRESDHNDTHRITASLRRGRFDNIKFGPG
jgi:hypothetical protein